MLAAAGGGAQCEERTFMGCSGVLCERGTSRGRGIAKGGGGKRKKVDSIAFAPLCFAVLLEEGPVEEEEQKQEEEEEAEGTMVVLVMGMGLRSLFFFFFFINIFFTASQSAVSHFAACACSVGSSGDLCLMLRSCH